MSKRIKFQQTLVVAALACLMIPQVASAGGKNGGSMNRSMAHSSSSSKSFSPSQSMSLRTSSNSVFSNKVAKVSSSNVLSQAKHIQSGNFKRLSQTNSTSVLVPTTKLGKVQSTDIVKMKGRTGSVFTPGKVLDPKTKGPLTPIGDVFKPGRVIKPSKVLDPIGGIFDPAKPGKGPILDPTKIPPVFDPGNAGGGKGPVLDPTTVPPVLDPGTGGGSPPPPPAGNGNGNCPPKDNCHNNHCNNYPWPIFLGGNYWNGSYGNPYQCGPYLYGSSAPQVVTQAVAIDTTSVAAQPVVAAPSSGDLILEDVILAEPATVLVGPAYRVKFRNQGLNAVSKFRVGLLAGKDGRVNDHSPRAMFDVEGLAGGQAGEVTIRLPRTAMQLVDTSGQSTAFTHLLVAIDIDGVVPEADKTNNVALVERASLESAR